jgi:peptide/nickel transport system ATP-binding protein
MELITVNTLSVDFIGKNDDMHALKNASLSVKKNEILGIVGESGCGKSTLIKSILRILSAPGLITSGEVLYNNQNILDLNDIELNKIRWKEISFVKQKALNSLNPVKTIGEQLMLPFMFHKSYSKSEASKSAYELLDLVKIDHKYFASFPQIVRVDMNQSTYGQF